MNILRTALFTIGLSVFFTPLLIALMMLWDLNTGMLS